MTTESWHGVATEDVEELNRSVSLKLQARSRRLLRSLLRPHLGAAALVGPAPRFLYSSIVV